MAIRSVIFDMDGLMIDTERLSASGWKKFFEKRAFLLHLKFFPLAGVQAQLLLTSDGARFSGTILILKN